MKVSLDNETHNYAQKANVVHKEDQNKENLPSKGFVSADEIFYKNSPRFTWD